MNIVKNNGLLPDYLVHKKDNRIDENNILGGSQTGNGKYAYAHP
jgi:hypothetical protein